MHIKVCAAIIIESGKILIAQRSKGKTNPLKWEFPGGKVEENESEQECIVREINEELGLKITPAKRLPPVYHSYIDYKIELIPFICEIIEGKPINKEHNELKWICPHSVENIDLADADKILLAKIKQLFRNL